ncbi:MAG TPA: hypothetical protein VFN89_02635 [Solirubrobacterales bacterium]|nr:hypothetical protein [Solirubrobacterales bacterium]
MTTSQIVVDHDDRRSAHEVKGTVLQVTALINYALSQGNRFQAFEGRDGKSFSVEVAYISHIDELEGHKVGL